MTAFEFTRHKPGWQRSRLCMENMNTSMTHVWGGGLSGPGGLFWAMKVWRLGCWPPWQDWLNTRWTWGWPETCSWWPRSESHTGLSKTESPLYLGWTQCTQLQGREPPGWRNLRVGLVGRSVYLCGARAGRPMSARGWRQLTADPDSENSSWREKWQDLRGRYRREYSSNYQ